MIVTTTPTVEGHRITGYCGVVFGEVITGINFLRWLPQYFGRPLGRLRRRAAGSAHPSA